MREIATDLALVPMMIANAYLVGNRASWVLVDSGTAGSEDKIREAAESRFGRGARPQAIILTHGHFDHSGSSPSLARLWNVRVYAHRLEWPYLNGQSSYPPLDPTAPGFFSALARFFPSHTVNVGNRLEEIGSTLPVLGMGDWQTINTPGHTPGHVSFFRPGDGVLLAGDALTTMDLDSFFATVTKRKQVCRPPVPGTGDWQQARRSVQALAELRPRVIAPGHGEAMYGAADELALFAAYFPIPAHGRYVAEPARADETGLTYLPPPPVDIAPKIAAGVTAGVAIAGLGAFLAKRARR